MKIKEIMNKAMVIEKDDTLKDAAKIMSDKNIGSLMVMDCGEVVGIITEKDIIKNISDINKKIEAVMSKKIVMIEDDEEIDDAALLMKKNKIKHLPVMNDGELTGIITATDLIAHSDELEEDFLI